MCCLTRSTFYCRYWYTAVSNPCIYADPLFVAPHVHGYRYPNKAKKPTPTRCGSLCSSSLASLLCCWDPKSGHSLGVKPSHHMVQQDCRKCLRYPALYSLHWSPSCGQRYSYQDLVLLTRHTARGTGEKSSRVPTWVPPVMQQ